MSHSAAGQQRTMHAALLTPSGRGAIAVIGIAGPRSAEILAAHFQPARSAAGREVEGIDRTADQPSHSRKLLKVGDVRFGYWLRSDGTREEVVLTRPRQDAFEVHCHGGPVICQSILNDLARVGCCVESWQEYCAALGANSWEITIRDMLAQARTEFAASVIASQARGAFHNALASVIDRVRRGHIAEAERVLQELYERGKLARHLIQPWHVTLLGPPNAGKSSLCNALVGYERAIVWPEPGTTRDVVDAEFVVDGWVFRLHDTAGLRSTTDPLEQEGVRRAAAMASASDVVLLVASPDTGTLSDAPDLEGVPVLQVVNKVDLYNSSFNENSLRNFNSENIISSSDGSHPVESNAVSTSNTGGNTITGDNITFPKIVPNNTGAKNTNADNSVVDRMDARLGDTTCSIAAAIARNELDLDVEAGLMGKTQLACGHGTSVASRGIVYTSALYGRGIEELRRQIVRLTVGTALPADAALPLTDEHRLRILRAKQLVQQQCVGQALSLLEELQREVEPLWRF